jgi:hypothetical protein
MTELEQARKDAAAAAIERLAANKEIQEDLAQMQELIAKLCKDIMTNI